MYLVTGGSGFCGFAIVQDLLRRGEKVRVLDMDPLPENLPEVEFMQADIRDAQAVTRACEGVEKIIHTVAKVPISKAGKEFWEVNVDGTRHVLDAAVKHQVKKVVHLSTSALQISNTNPVPEDAAYNPIGAYGKSKMDGELLCFEYVKKGLNLDVIRPRTVVGLGRLGIFDILFDWIQAGKNIFILGSGKNTIQFLHVDDLAKCCFLSANNPKPAAFNVGSRSFGPLREDLQSLIDHAGTKSKIIGIPVWPAIATLATLDFLRLSPLAPWHYLTYHRDFYFNNENAKKVLGWEPEFGNQEILKIAYDGYLEMRKKGISNYGQSHRKALNQGILKLLRR